MNFASDTRRGMLKAVFSHLSSISLIMLTDDHTSSVIFTDLVFRFFRTIVEMRCEVTRTNQARRSFFPRRGQIDVSKSRASRSPIKINSSHRFLFRCFFTPFPAFVSIISLIEAYSEAVIGNWILNVFANRRPHNCRLWSLRRSRNSGRPQNICSSQCNISCSNAEYRYMAWV
jgi:hypothetical protein